MERRIRGKYMKYLDVKWKLILDPDTRNFLETAYSGDIENILGKIAEGVEEGFYSGLFTMEIGE
jgi:hypothetical protein